MNLPTLLTEAAMKGAERRTELGIIKYSGDAHWYVINYDSYEKLFQGQSPADCTAFIEREGLRASMAWLAEKIHEVDGANKQSPRRLFQALAGCGEG